MTTTTTITLADATDRQRRDAKDKKRAAASGRTFSRISNGVVWLVLIVIVIGTLYPLVWMVMSGFKSSAEIFASPWSLPSGLDPRAYVEAWDKGILEFVLNSVIVTGVSLVLIVALAAMAAYGLTKFRFRGAKLFTYILLGGLMVSPTMIMIPLFQMLQALNLYNTHAGLIIVYVAYRLPFMIFLIRAYMSTLDDGVLEAAIVDGASQIQVFVRIVLPMCMPVLVSAGLVHFLWAWNEFPFALIFLNDTSLKTLPVGLLDFKSALQTDWPVLFAGLVLAALPVVVAFLIGQRQFIRGLSAGMGK
ncbi:carbohydrate ABC transporter permease [Microbacterium sp. YY-03]|uniref:Carbohydrate ABC transporter permease n=1 Tax=Microbacterium mitrae TaxID=664640 RepID=A0A5C8HQ36_9MICO|nr:carbohydrate ABC transporter permease [Microbacterium mitrae]TXK06250.1 carbohydrate ABC transporter permease [Microbacterium mitrae]